jgi:hypothetical protein
MTIDECEFLAKKIIDTKTIKVPPIFKIGTKVKTMNSKHGYINTVIGIGTVGVIVTEECIPLVDFGKYIGSFYVRQEKLKKVYKFKT